MIRTMVYLLCCIVPLCMAETQQKRCTSVACIDTLFHKVYELRLSRRDAVPEIRTAHAFLRYYCGSHPVPRSTRAEWVFPVHGYSAAAIGGSRGEGYRGASAYDFFDGNSHGGHPAHDVFIHDRNFDALDDKTGKPTPVVAVSGGVVVCVNSAWTPDSLDAKRRQSIRGGIYVWVYDPVSDGLHYYAHLGETACKAGDHVAAGDIIGSVGRTGKNAFPRKSPTHLHYMYLAFKDGRPLPEDVYRDLLKARSSKSREARGASSGSTR